MKAELKVIKSNTENTHEINLKQLIVAENDGFEIFVRLHCFDMPYLSIIARPRDTDYIGFSYDSDRYGKNGGKFIYDLRELSPFVPEDKLEWFIKRKAEMLEYTKETIKNVEQLIRDYNLEAYM